MKTIRPFFILLIFISVATVFSWSNSLINHENVTFRVALNPSKPIDEIDTKSITDSSDYSVLELLLSPLVEYNNQGEIIGGIAERFYWNENELIFEFRETSFSSGNTVTPEDAVATFKRLMILNTNSHGELANLLCSTASPKSLDDSCGGIRADGKRLILTARKKTAFLLPLLTSIDYGILSKSSIDPRDLKIISFENTSGPYMLKKVDGKNFLYANKKHWHYNPKIPQQIEFVPFDYDSDSPRSAENQFIKEKVDFIPTASELRLDDVEKIRGKTGKQFQIHRTNPMALVYAKYTKTGKKLPIETRRRIFACINHTIKKNINNDPTGRSATIQVLPPSAEGNLSLEQIRLIEAEIEKYSHECNVTGIRIAVPQFLLEFYKHFLDAENNKFKMVGYPDIEKFENTNDDDVPELTILGVDVASIEDINFISYAVKNGILVPSGNQVPAQWLKQYFDTPEKSDRLAMLQKIHFVTVWEDPSIIPFSIRPFVSVIDSKWSTDFSKLFPNDPFWKIKIK